MDTKNDIELHDLETIEDNLCVDDSRRLESDDELARASATAFMIP